MACGKADTTLTNVQTFAADANSVFIGKEKFDLREVESIVVKNLDTSKELILSKKEQDKLVLAWNHSKEMGIVTDYKHKYQIEMRVNNSTIEKFISTDKGLIKHNSDYAFQLKDEALLSSFKLQ